MVLAYQVKRSAAVLLMLVGAVSCAKAAPSAGTCSPARLLSTLMSTDAEWETTADIAKGAKEPVTGITVGQKKLWVSTYYDDFSPVEPVPSKDRLELKNLRFQYAPSFVQDNQVVNYVRAYSNGKARFFIQAKCDDLSTIELRVEFADKSKRPELVRLKRKDK